MSTEQTTISAVLGVVLTNLRKEQSIEQAEMAARMGLSQASYSRLETGKATFSVDQMYQAANALAVSSEEISRRLNQAIVSLEANNFSVEPQVRGNTSQARKDKSRVGPFVVGAALGALLFRILSNKN